MSKTMNLDNNWIAICESGYEGEVIFRKLAEDGETVEGEDKKLPVSVIKSFVAELVRDSKIAKLEDASNDAILGL